VLFLFGLRDPLSIANIDAICDGISAEVARHFGAPGNDGYRLFFHVYGRDAILGDREPRPDISSHEVCIVIEAVAAEEELAKKIAKLAKYSALRVHYPGKLGTAGGCAMLADDILRFSVPAYEWAVDHLLPLEDPLAPFPIELERVP
jgi:hypothetical protein